MKSLERKFFSSDTRNFFKKQEHMQAAHDIYPQKNELEILEIYEQKADERMRQTLAELSNDDSTDSCGA